MIEHNIEFKDKVLGQGLGDEVCECIEFDLAADFLWLRIPYNNPKIVEGLLIPLREESNGSLLITLDEIRKFVEQTSKTPFDVHFEVYFESSQYGAVLHYNNYGDRCWRLHGVTNGYA